MHVLLEAGDVKRGKPQRVSFSPPSQWEKKKKEIDDTELAVIRKTESHATAESDRGKS